MLDSNVQFSTTATKQGIQRNRNVWTIQKRKKSTETVPEKDLMMGLPDEDFKTTVSEMLRERTKRICAESKQTKK